MLTQSLVRDTFNKGWCNRCKTYPQLRQRRLYNELPPVLTINALSEQEQKIWSTRWATPGWLPTSIGIVFNPTDGNVRCAEENVDRLIAQARKGEVVYCYDLVGVVAQIYSTRECRSHLVAMVSGKGSRAENAALTNMQSSPLGRRGSRITSMAPVQ